jgi:RND family efflux transporter MFP subunit
MFPRSARLSAILALVLPLALAGCGDGGSQPAKAQKGPPAAPTVTVAKPVQREVAATDEYVGRFAAVDSVEIRARVSGHLERVHFTDGALVRKGDPLFTIDQRPFEAARDQANADVQRARAQAELADAEFERARSLVERKAIAEALYEQRIQAQRAAQAQLQAAEANLRNANLNLEFTELRAPIAGRIGDRRVSSGNLVTGGPQQSTTLLATIVSIDPIRFEFSFDEAAFLRYSRLAGDSKHAGARGNAVPIELRLLDEAEFVHKGKMDFVDNVIDRSSGTIRGRAEFDNPEGLFVPGMFGRVRVAAAPPALALLVPEDAIGTEQVRKFVYVVDDENTVHQKFITLGRIDQGLRVVEKGLEPDDRVIVNGLMRTRPGIKVTPRLAGEGPPRPPVAGSPRAAK